MLPTLIRCSRRAAARPLPHQYLQVAYSRQADLKGTPSFLRHASSGTQATLAGSSGNNATKQKKAASSTKTQLRLDRDRAPAAKRGPPDGQAIAVTTAERYDIDALRKALWHKNLLGRGDGKDAVNLMGEAVWIPSWPLPPNGSEPLESTNVEKKDTAATGEIFVFETGSFVAWHMTEGDALSFVKEVLRDTDGLSIDSQVEKERYPEMQTEAMDFVVKSGESTGVRDDLIVIGTSGVSELPLPKIETTEEDITAANSSKEASKPLATTIEPISSLTSSLFTPQNQIHKRKPAELRAALPRGEDDLAARLSLSTGLARSTKLAVYEEMLEDCVQDVATVPSLLISNSNAPLDRKQIQRNTGRLLLIRQYLNLNTGDSENLMDPPEFFWSHSKIEIFFNQMVKNLEITQRLRNLNTKLDYSLQVQATLQEMESTKVSHRLEWIIIALIAAEIGLALMREGLPKWPGSKHKEVNQSIERV